MSDEFARHTAKLLEACLIGYFQVSKTPTFKIKAETECKTFLMKMSFICMRIENHFHINSFALRLAKKQRLVRLGKGLWRCDKNEL